MKNLKFILLAVVAMFFSAAVAVAQDVPQKLTLPSFVGSNMVLQHSTTVNLWGWAKPNAKVTIDCDWVAGKPVKIKADAEGFWILPVQTLGAGYDAHTITIKAGKDVEVLENVVFGEVWLCSGQSNMQWYVMRDPEMKADLKNPANSKIRLYDTGRIWATTPQNEVPAQKKHKTQWSVCNPKALAKFTAVGYGFGKELQEALDVPVGLIDASYGGTTIESWISADYVAKNSAKDKRLAKIANYSKKKKPHKRVSQLHNANIYPIRYATIAGVIWYQGCSNVWSTSNYYYSLLNNLVKSWREEFRNPELPFYIVQIVPHLYEGNKGAIVREAQDKVAARTANCELVVTNDQNHVPGDIHPPKKTDVAHRLALCALGAHYKKSDAPFRSPAYQSMTVEGNNVRVAFKNVPTTLVQKGEGRINGFQLGVKDPENEKNLIFSVAEAKIEGKEVVVWAEGVEAPVAVRYCFNEDMGNVFSAEGLPLAPFRSDKSRSLSARPYVEKPSEIAVQFDGEGYTRTKLTEGAQLWEGHTFVMSDVYPKEFEGFELLVPAPVEKGMESVGGTITAQADGKIYLLAASNPALRKNGWTTLTSTYTRCAKDGKLDTTLYIVERDVKAGEVVELPKIKSKSANWGTSILAKSIEY